MGHVADVLNGAIDVADSSLDGVAKVVAKAEDEIKALLDAGSDTGDEAFDEALRQVVKAKDVLADNLRKLAAEAERLP